MKDRDSILAHIIVKDSFIFWMRRKISNAVLELIDPYRDVVLGNSLQQQLLYAVKELRFLLQEEIAAKYAKPTKFPKDLDLRRKILANLLDRDLQEDKNWQTFKEIEAFIELAIENELEIEIFGD